MTMESFYPKIGEVELVLVEDDNDFFDPLETNFECEDENEDVKLQLNDEIHEESQFHLESSDNPDTDSNVDEHPVSSSIKREIVEQNGDVALVANKTSHRSGANVKLEKPHEISDDSMDASDINFFDNDSNHSSDITSMEIKPNVEEMLRANNSIAVTATPKVTAKENKSKRQQKTKVINENDIKEPIDRKLRNDKKPIKCQTKLDKKSKTKCMAKIKSKVKIKVKVKAKVEGATEKTVDKNDTSNNVAETDVKVSNAKPKEEKSSEYNSKTTRHYSKRNEIPKNAVHNEAYDKKLMFCKICSIQFDRSPAFTEHMRAEHSIDKPFECFICTKAYRISSLLAEHIRYHFGEKPYKCDFCERRFSQLQPYKAHIRKSHTLERPYKCNFIDENNVKCEETFFDTKTYKFHMREHTNDQPYTCEFCGKKFNHAGSYHAHMRIHTNERPYQCVICGKSFAQISTHKAHMLTHSDEYKFPCPQCDKKFKQANNLKLHMRVHTKETPYTCEDCGRGFAQLVTYRNHRRIHTGEKPYPCSYDNCGRSFRHRNSLRRHLQTHTGEKPFECRICFKRLSQPSSYTSHMRRHERHEKPEKI